jgi:hypothetical protein
MISKQAVVEKLAKTPKRDASRTAEDSSVLGLRMANDLVEQVRSLATELETTTSRLLAALIQDSLEGFERASSELERASSELIVVSPKTREKGRSTT